MAAGLADRMRPVLLSLLQDPGSSGPRHPRGVMIALSGGVDSTVLLRLAVETFREVSDQPHVPRLVAAHLDHGMRAGSGEDAAAVFDLCDEWGVPCRTERVSTAPRSETDARRLRYAFLNRVAAEEDIGIILTGHHADDEIETLLHRVVRGTGVTGLKGIPRHRGRYRRPFLMARPPVRRGEIESWAGLHALPIREDPTNMVLETPRNRIRHRILPELERVRAGAAEGVLRLARNARRTAAELDALADALLTEREDSIEIEVSIWQRGPVPLRRALLRRAMGRMGVRASEAVTRAALRMSPEAQSGKGVDLPGGLRFERRFEHWVLTPDQAASFGAPVSIPTSASGAATLSTPGRTVRIAWGTEPRRHSGHPTISLDPGAVRFPLLVRGWRPGDRIARGFGHTSVAQWLAEQRVPRRKRADHVVVEDADERLVAVEGLGAADGCQGSAASESTLHVELAPTRSPLTPGAGR